MKAARACLAAMFLSAGVVPAAQDPGDRADDCDVQSLYRGAASLWTDDAGRATPLAFDALGAIEKAPADGLDAADYDAAALRARAIELGGRARPPISRSVDFDYALSHAMIHFVQDLHRGRVDPQAAGFAITRRDGRAALDVLRAAIDRKQMSSIAREAAPKLTAYTALVEELRRYRLTAQPAERIRQIELSLERLRWLPELPRGPVVAINIPAFRLWAWDETDYSRPALSMRVSVGRASKSRTPMFIGGIASVIVRPFWNVPRSIAAGEILPRLTRDPGYLDRENMEIVVRSATGTVVVPSTPDWIAAVRRGAADFRQRPGPGNSLGLLKFVFPNNSGVYIHGTPSPQLFKRERRDLSHGCIRAEDSVGLAAWLLGGEWTRDRVTAATNGDETRTIDLGRRVPIVLFYATAFVGPDDGELQFVPDIYGHDAKLDKLLTARRRDAISVR